MTFSIGVLALQGGFREHITHLRQASSQLLQDQINNETPLDIIEVRSVDELARCDALVIPGGESTAISLLASQNGLLDPLRRFVNVDKKPTWGTCAGLILLSDEATAIKKGGQQLIGGLAVRVHRNHFGRQINSFQTNLDLPFLGPGSAPFPAIFIRAPVVDEILNPSSVRVLATLPARPHAGSSLSDSSQPSAEVVAVQQANLVGTSFHPELTSDSRFHLWWLREILSQQ